MRVFPPLEKRILQQLPGLPQRVRNLRDSAELLRPVLREAACGRPGERRPRLPIGRLPGAPSGCQRVRRCAGEVRAQHRTGGAEAPRGDEEVPGVVR